MASVGSWLAMPLIILGYLFAAFGLIKIGIVVFSATVVFQLVTLPVEFDASFRAKKALAGIGLTTGTDEERGVAKVLNGAALTYVAATLTAVAQLLYFVLLAQRRD